jgi:membrane protein involved in colicin uptake
MGVENVITGLGAVASLLGASMSARATERASNAAVEAQNKATEATRQANEKSLALQQQSLAAQQKAADTTAKAQEQATNRANAENATTLGLDMNTPTSDNILTSANGLMNDEYYTQLAGLGGQIAGLGSKKDSLY